MAENSKIEWTDHTFNPWIGCTKVSPGCANCYAETLMDTRYKRVKWGKGNPRQRTSASNWKNPLKWNEQSAYDQEEACATGYGEVPKHRVFCASLADWLDDEVPIEWLADLLALIDATPNLDWLLLTKRPENFWKRVGMVRAMTLAYIMSAKTVDNFFLSHPDCEPYAAQIKSESEDVRTEKAKRWKGASGLVCAWTISDAENRDDEPPKNVWLGTSVEDQKRADERIPELLKIPAVVRFLSCEPLLEAVDLSPFLWRSGCIPHCGERCSKEVNQIHWVIVGGESGPDKRPIQLECARSLRDQCKAAGVSCFFKQVDKVQPIPPDLQIREFPNV